MVTSLSADEHAHRLRHRVDEFRWGSLWFLLAGVVSLAGAYLIRVDLDQSGLILLLSHAADLSLVLWTSLLACSIGIPLTFSQRELPPALRVAAATCLGAVSLGTVLLAGAAIGFLRPVSYLVFPISGVVVWVKGWDRASMRAIKEAWNDLRDTVRPFPVATITIVPIIAIALLAALQPIADWDSLMYHLLMPWRWFDLGHLSVPDGNHHGAFIGAIQMLYAPFRAFDANAAPSLFQVVALVGTLTVVTEAARRHGGQLAGVLAAALVAGSTALLLVSVIPRIDMWLTLVIAALHILVIEAFTRPTSPSLITLSGLLAGAAVAMKYQGLQFALASAAFLLVVALNRRSPVTLGGVAIAAGFALLVGLPWMLKNVVMFGDPFYPFIRGQTTWQWLATLSPGYQVAGQYSPLGETRLPFSLAGWLLSPSKLFMQGEGELGGLHPLMALAPLAVALPGPRRAATVALGQALFGVVLILSVSDTTNLRYLNPAFPGLAIATALGLGYLAERIDRRRLKIFMTGIVLASLMLSFLWMGRRVAWNGLGYSLGAESQATWEARPFNHTGAVLRQVDEWLIESGAERTLLLLEPRSAHFDSDVIQDILQNNWPHMWAALEGACPRHSTFTHVLVNYQNLEFFVGRGMNPQTYHWDEFAGFADRCLQMVEERGWFALYKVR